MQPSLNQVQVKSRVQELAEQINMSVDEFIG